MIFQVHKERYDGVCLKSFDVKSFDGLYTDVVALQVMINCKKRSATNIMNKMMIQ